MISDPLFPGVRIFAVAARFPSHLVITWTDGVTRLVDVGDALRGHTLLDMLNIPEVFVDVEVINRGAGIGWANGADFCAHALRMKSDEQELAKSKVVAT